MPSGFRISNTSSGWANTDFDDVFVSRDLFTEGGAWYLGGPPSVIPHASGNYRSNPIQATGGGTNWRSLASVSLANHGIKTDGTLWAEGFNAPNGMMGTNGVGGSAFVFVQVGTDNTWFRTAQFSYGRAATGAIKNDGTLWMWGRNDGTCTVGDGTTTNRSSPVQVSGGGTNWKQLATGGYFAGGLKTDGTIWMWGGGNAPGGTLGDGLNITTNSPTKTIGDNWKQLTTGKFHTAAVKNDGTLWGWGSGSGGRLGTDNTVDRSSPVQISGTNWKQVSASVDHSLAIKTDGTLWTWGTNSRGQLGDNTTTNKSSPIQTITGGTNWKLAYAAAYFTVANKTDGTLWVWGCGQCGAMGINSKDARSSPVQTTAGGTNWRVFNSSTVAGAIRIDCW